MRALLLLIGAIAIVAGSFFGTLFVYDYLYQLPYPDNVRAAHATAVKEAMEKYRVAKGGYPAYSGPLEGLKRELVSGGFIGAVPLDPVYASDPTNGYQIAANSTAYGLLVHLKNATDYLPANSACMTGVKFDGVGWWGNPPKCPF